MLSIAAIALPVLGMAYILIRAVRQVATRVWRSTEGRPGRRAVAGLVAVVLLILLGVMAYKLVEVYGDLSAAKEQEARLRTQVEQKGEENNSLKDALSHDDDPDYILGLARDRLGLVEDGERIFPDVNN